MTKYIDVDAHLDNMFSTIDSFGDCFKQATYRGEPLTIAGVKTLLRESLRNAPAADVVEVRRGNWLKHKYCGETYFVCPQCETLVSPQWKCCPVCCMMAEKEEG